MSNPTAEEIMAYMAKRKAERAAKAAQPKPAKQEEDEEHILERTPQATQDYEMEP